MKIIQICKEEKEENGEIREEENQLRCFFAKKTMAM